MSKKLPPLPATVWSPLGPVKVKLVKNLTDENNMEIFGDFSGFKRRIRINKKLSPEMRWMTLEHETMHLIFFDSGIRQHIRQFDRKTHGGALEELIADAVGTYKAAARKNAPVKRRVRKGR